MFFSSVVSVCCSTKQGTNLVIFAAPTMIPLANAKGEQLSVPALIIAILGTW